MKTLLMFLALGGATVVSAQTITEVGPAASYIPTGLPNGGIAQGSFFYIKGSGLGPATGVVFTGPAAYTMGTDLAGTRVKVQIGPSGPVIDAFPYYTSANQVNVILPSNTPVGNGTVSVLYNGATVNANITVVRAAFGIFTLNSGGTGGAVATNASTYEVKTFTTALHPGDVATVWGTGLGPVTFPDNQPAQFVRLENGVSVIVGGKPATIQFAGRAPGYSGLDQVNFVVPDGVTGCTVPIVVRIGSVSSNFASVPIATSGNACSDSRFTTADVAAVQSGASIGIVSLARTKTKGSAAGVSFEANADIAGGTFVRYDYNSLIRSDIGSTTPSVGSCAVQQFRGSSAPVAVIPQFLDAGAKLTLTSSGGTKDINKGLIPGMYSLSGGSSVSTVPGVGTITMPINGGPFLDSGNVTVTGPGGADVGPFSASIGLSTPLTWTNQPTTVPRNLALTVNWTGGGANDQVIIYGSSVDTTNNLQGVFTCLENASAGTFTVPSYVLASMPASIIAQGIPNGALGVGSYNPGVRFTANGLTIGLITYQTLDQSTVNFQ